jgi:hypothetical protein
VRTLFFPFAVLLTNVSLQGCTTIAEDTRLEFIVVATARGAVFAVHVDFVMCCCLDNDIVCSLVTNRMNRVSVIARQAILSSFKDRNGTTSSSG